MEGHFPCENAHFSENGCLPGRANSGILAETSKSANRSHQFIY